MKNKRITSAILMVAIAVTVNAVLACIMALISSSPDKAFVEVFRNAFMLCFALFGGSFVAAAVLILATRMAEDHALMYGAGFYYGAFLFAYILIDCFYMEDSQLALLLSSIISALCCYIFWLKRKKEQ